MSDKSLSPAVMSFQNERQSSGLMVDALQKGLEDTFPASDPVSASSSIAQSGAPADDASSEAPRVDQVLETLRSRADTSFASEELAALKEELLSLRDRVAQVGVDLKDHASDQIGAQVGRLEATIQRKPWAAIATAAALGFIIGRTR